MSEGKPEVELRGYTYEVSDAQLRVFRSRTPDERLHWLDEARAFSIALAPPQARDSWKRLRRGA